MGLTVGTTIWNDTNRIQFSINPTTVSGSIVVPFIFKLSTSTGLGSYDCSYVFEQLSVGGTSVTNRKKVIFSQVVDGEEEPLYCELDSWDHEAELAFFYVKPLDLSSINSNIFFFYFDKEQGDNTRYLSETNEFPVILAMDLGAEGTSDTGGVLPIDVIKVGDLYQMWYRGYSSLWTIIYCESADLLTWTNHQVAFDHSHTYDTSHHSAGSVIYDDGVYKMWYSATNGSNYRILYCDSLDGINWDNFQLVVNIGTTPYNAAYSINCAVIKETSLYKMWYCGYHSTSSVIARGLYCESTDGINWVNHQLVISDEVGVNGANGPYLRPSTVIYKDSLYRMWLDVYNGTTWKPYYGESKDGINWQNFSLFTDLNTLGVHDTAHTGLNLKVLEESGYYYSFYGGHDGAVWRMLGAKSVSLTTPKTPSQEVWSDFFSVHHLNSTYGYIDSTSSRLNTTAIVEATPVTSNIGSSALEFTSTRSSVNLGTSTRYGYGDETTLLMFSNITAEGRLYNKDGYIHTYYYDHPTMPCLNSLSVTFSGTDGDFPDPWLWNAYTYDTRLIESDVYIDNNRLKVHSKVSTENYASTYAAAQFYLEGDFDVEYAFSDYSYYTSDSMGGIFAGGLIACAEEGSYWWLRIPGVSDTHRSGRAYNYGQMRITRIGTNYTIYLKDGPATTWLSVKSGGDGTAPDFQVLLRAYVSSGTNASSTIYFESFSCTADNIRYSYNTKNTPSLNTFWRDADCLLKDTSIDSEWHLYSMGRQTSGGANVFIDRSGQIGQSGFSDYDFENSSSTYIGDPYNCALGKVAEVWWTYDTYSYSTERFIEKMFKDEVLIISTNFVHGYTTEYGKAVATKVLVYDKTTKNLVGYTNSSIHDGFYYAEVTSEDECFIVALDGGFYNHFIQGKVIPQNII